MRIEHLYLLIAIAGEVFATSMLKRSGGFSRPLPSLIVAAGYTTSFYFLSLALRAIPLGVAYAIWSGVGIVALACIGIVIYREPFDLAALIGFSLIIAGIVILNLFSRTTMHG